MLKAIVDTLDEVDAKYHDLYVEKDGKFHLQVEGIEHTPVVKNLKDEAAKSRIKARTAEDALTKFTGLGGTAEEIQAKLDRIEELEAANGGKIDEVKINELVEVRIKTKLAPVQRELDQAKTQLLEKDGVIAGYKDRDVRLSIADSIRVAGKKSGLLDAAIDDAILLGERVFSVDEGGSITAKEGVGVTPGIDPAVWLTEMQPKRPHWWGPSQGGGAMGGKGGNVGSNPWSHDNWNMTEQGRMYKENPTRAEQMAKSAGTTIGGQRPAAKK